MESFCVGMVTLELRKVINVTITLFSDILLPLISCLMSLPYISLFVTPLMQVMLRFIFQFRFRVSWPLPFIINIPQLPRITCLHILQFPYKCILVTLDPHLLRPCRLPLNLQIHLYPKIRLHCPLLFKKILTCALPSIPLVILFPLIHCLPRFSCFTSQLLHIFIPN